MKPDTEPSPGFSPQGKLCRAAAFTLIELLVVISIVAILLGLLMPALGSGRDAARATQCLANLGSLGRATGMYHHDFKEYFMPGVRTNWPTPGKSTYYWGSVRGDGTINRDASGFMTYIANRSEAFECPMQPWGSYVPQGGARELTTNFGYNGWCLDPPWWGRKNADGDSMPRKRIADIRQPEELFVFADSAMYWKPAGVEVLQNSTSLDPVTFTSTANTTPTTHFRHHGKTNALTADGSARTYDSTGSPIIILKPNIGFVGAANFPHYDQ